MSRIYNESRRPYERKKWQLRFRAYCYVRDNMPEVLEKIRREVDHEYAEKYPEEDFLPEKRVGRPKKQSEEKEEQPAYDSGTMDALRDWIERKSKRQRKGKLRL